MGLDGEPGTGPVVEHEGGVIDQAVVDPDGQFLDGAIDGFFPRGELDSVHRL